MTDDARAAVARVHRAEWARIVAGLARRFGDLDIAEEAAAEAFAIALERWTDDRVPPNPGGWLTITARRLAIDRLRRDARAQRHHRDAASMPQAEAPPVGIVDDDRLRMLFVCCHPVLGMRDRLALSLRLVGGLTVGEIASAFLVQEAAMARRITRAKTRIRESGVPFRVPWAADLPDRIDGVLAALALMGNEGYLASNGADAVRPVLLDEAIRMARLARELLPDHGEVRGLLALLVLLAARTPARVTEDGALVALGDQDRSAWDRAGIAEGLALLGASAEHPEALGRYQLLAAIHGVHCAAPSLADTSWTRIVALYDLLCVVDPSPVVRVNRAVALAERDGPAAGLAEVDAVAERLEGYRSLHAARADLLDRLGRGAEARAAWDRAIALAGTDAEATALRGRRDRHSG